MKMWKRILTLVLVLFASVTCFFACGDNSKYDNMSIAIKNIQGLSDDNVFVLSSSGNSVVNTFSFDAEVVGASRGVDKGVTCSISDPNKLRVTSAFYDESTGITSFEVEATDGGMSSITISSVEGNKTYELIVKIEVPVELVSYKSKVLAVVRGEEYSIKSDNLSFFPENPKTTQTKVHYQITAIDEGDNEDIAIANEYLAQNGKILVNSTLRYFYLDVYSDYIEGETPQDRAIVNVIDKIEASKVGIIENREDTSDYASYELLAFENGKYTLTLASNTDQGTSFRTFSQTTLQFVYGEGETPMGEETFNGYVLNDKGEFTLANSEKFSIRLKEISASDNGKYDLGIAELGNKNSSDFDFEISSKSDGEMTLVFIIDYKGFEGVFEPIEIPLTLKVSMFPHEIRVYSSKDAMERAKNGKLSEDTYSVKNDGELILYTSSASSDADNYLLTPVYVCVWGEDYALNNQEVALSINNASVSIVDSTGENPVEFVYSGGVFYLKKIDAIDGDLKLTITSTVYENVSTEIILSYTNEAVNVQFEDISIDLDIATFSNDTSEFNGNTVSLVAGNIVTFAGLPRADWDKTKMDYSVVEVVFASNEFAEAKYDSASNDIIIRPKNKIGSTMIKFVIKDVYTSNGKEFESGWKTFSVNYPLNSADLLKAQIEGFENVDNGDYKYRFVGSEQDGVTVKTELLAGQTYNLYFLLGEDDDNSQKYEDISLFVTQDYVTTSSSTVVVDGRLINVKSSSSEPVRVVYCYSPKVGSANQTLDKIYITFEIYTRSAIKNLTTTLPKISLYDYNSISQNIKNPVSNVNYCDEVGVADFEIGLNPTDANVDYKLSWSVIIGGSALTPSIQTNKENKIYTFTTNRGTQIVLNVDVKDGLSASLKVLTIPEDGIFTFELRAVAEQTYIQPAYTKDATNIGSSRIALNIPVTVKKASSVSNISVGAFNNTVKFDARDMTKNGEGEYVDNNHVSLDYELKTSGNIDNVVIKDIEFYTPNSDIDISCDDKQISITYKAMNLEEPEYKIYMVALGSLNGKWTSNTKVDYGNVTTYYNVYTEIIVKVANGKTIPFEIDSAEDLIAIGNTSKHPEAMTSNYVLTSNIDLKDYNWEAIGGGEEFKGTLSGRYYLNDNTYNDYEIYNLTVNVSSSDLANENNYFGLFGCIGKDAVISNVTLKNFNIKISRGTNTPLTDYIGVLAGKNDGQIIDCTIDDGIISDALNGALIAMCKTGISYDTTTCGLTIDANIGGLVGFNDIHGVIKSSTIKINIGIMDCGTSASASVMAGGMVGKNSGTIYGGNTKEQDEIIVYSNNFVATSGISGFDVVAVINASMDSSKVSNKSAYGGVVGSNFENGSYAEILGVTARSFVFGSGNIGGLVGQNNAKITNSLVVPNLIGSGNIGGLVGYSSGLRKSLLASEGRNIVVSNKVQMINYNDSYSYMNTSIYATSGSNVGGLIGVYEDGYTSSDWTEDGTLNLSFAHTLGYNSVRSYLGDSISPEYSRTDANKKYYGDIVIAKGSTNVNVSGFVGRASNTVVANGYAKATIVFEANDSVYVGGVLGKGSEIISIFNFSALGVVYNISNSVKSNNIGNFIGDATNINTVSLSKGESIDGFYLLNILYRVSDDAWNSEYNNLVAYNPDVDSPSNDIKTETRSYIDKITISADANSLSYKYANVMYSYSTIQARNYYYSQISEEKEYYLNNFFANNEKITITNNISGGKVYYRENGIKSEADSIEFTNVVATNSFYIGFGIKKFHDGSTVKEINYTVNANSISQPNVIDENGFNLFGLNASSYSNTLVVKISRGGEPVSIIESVASDAEYAYYLAGVSRIKYNGLYLCNNSETGLSATLPAGYLRYYNKDVDGGCVLSFAYENTYNKDSVDYVNLIVDIPPTILKTTAKLEVDVDDGRLLSSKSEVTGDTTTISYETNTLVYYQLDYSKLNYNVMSVNGVDTKVIDFNLDGKYSSLDISYTTYVNNLIDSKNIYKLSEAVDISILPPFLQSGLVSFKSSNSDVAYIDVIDGEAYVVVCGEGVVTFTVYSIYNQDGENATGDNVATFTVNIVSKVDDFGIYSDMTLNSSSEIFTDDSSLIILKSNVRSTQVYVNLKAQLDYANDYLRAYSKVDLALKNNNSYGVMIFYIHNNSIYFNEDISHNGIKINSKTFSKLTFGSDYDKVGAGKYALYVDAGNEVSFTGLEVLEGLRLLVVPYIKHSNNTKTILYDLNFNGVVGDGDDLDGGIAKIITLRVIEGSESVSSVDSASFSPNNTLETKVSIKTDNSSAELFLNVSRNLGSYLNKIDIYSNIEKSTKCDYVTSVSNYPDKQFDDLGVEMRLGTYYFDKVYITVTSIAFKSESGQKEYSIRIGVCDKYLFDNDLIANYVLNFNIVNLEAEMSTSTTNLAISGQSITNSIANTFSSIDEYLEDKDVYDLADYYESSTMVAGYPGLLQINLFPEYANVDYVEITSEVINGYYVSMEQMVSVFNTSGVFDGYYKIYNEKRDIINNGAGIRVKNYSYFYQNDYKYNGTYYIRTIIPTTPRGVDSFTITYKCYFEGKVVHERSLVLDVARIPDLRLTVNGGKTGVVALGKSINIEAETESKITWSVNNVFTSVTENNATAPTELGNGLYSVNIKPISVIGVNNYQDYIGKDMVITATVELDIKGRVYKVSDSVTIRLALFTIDDITVKNVSNGYFHGTYNQPYDLRLTIVASYDEDFDKANGNFISSAISELSNKLSYYSARSFYIIEGSDVNVLEPGQYSDVLVTRNGNYLTIKNNRKNITSNLKASITFTYSTYTSTSYGIYFSTATNFCYNVENRFGLDFIRLSNEENPEPIYTAEELMNMEEGGYYILLDDITLTDWQPLDIAIASLDGNGYVITVESFDYVTLSAPEVENEKDGELTLGIFSKIYENTVIKNLIIEVGINSELTSDVLDTRTGDLVINAQYYSDVTFGLLAGTNEGIITNVNITNNANSYRNQRNRLLYNSGAITEYTGLSESGDRKLAIVNVDNGSTSSTASENRIATMVGVNSGYISNSSVTNVSIYGLDCVAGFVAENKNIISSSYFSGGNVHANVSADKSKTLGASGFVFKNSGKILYSYVAGMTGTHTNLTGINIGGFAGSTYSDNATNGTTAKLALRYMDTGVVSESGNTSSFVYSNGGKISDCYSNFLVYGSETSGFVYSNSGEINNVYTLSSVIAKSSIHNPFISMIAGAEAGAIEPNNSGSITNAFFLSVTSDELLDENGSTIAGLEADQFLNSSNQVAQPISASKLSNYSTFESFAFNANMDSVSSIEGVSALEEIVRSVWFYPSSITNGSIYFKQSSYLSGAPQLVSANLNNYSLKYYVTDNETKMIESVYSGLLESSYSSFIASLGRADILIDVELKSASTVASIEFSTADNKIEALSNALNSMGYTTNSTDLASQNLQYIKVKLYLSDEEYKALTDEASESSVSNDIVNIVRTKILGLNLYNLCYIKVELVNESVNPLPSIDSTYEYVSVLELTSSSGTSSQTVGIEYGSSILNPYLVKSANDYNVFVMRIDENFESNVIYNNYQSSIYLRLVKDFAFEGNDGFAKTYNVIYSGVLDGNGMTISSLRVNADTTLVNTLQNGANYSENEVNNGKKATSVGMFAKLCSGGTVKNLSIDVSAVNATGVNFVGAVAGQVIDGRLYNIDTYSSSSATVLGRNIAGGIAGRISGQSSIVNLSSSISVSAYYYAYDNKVNSKNLELNNQVASRYSVYMAPVVTESAYTSSNYSDISYAGGVAGIVDLDEPLDSVSGTIDISAISRVRSVKVTGSPTILGEVVGGLYGSLGVDTVISASAVIVGDGANLNASRVAGGLIGINYGTITRSYIENDDQESIDASIKTSGESATGLYGDNIDNGLQTFFGGNPHYIGGLVGINIGGAIMNSYGRVDVSNIDSSYAGGLIGATLGGTFNTVYTSANVYAFYGIGGLIGLNSGYELDNVKDGESNLKDTYDNNIDFADVHLFSHVANPQAISGGTAMISSATINLQAIVAVNMWKKVSLNTNRGHINSIANMKASIGSIIGYSDTSLASKNAQDRCIINNEKIVTDMSGRYIDESIYTVASYTFDSIDSNAGLVLLEEVGNYFATPCSPASSTNNTDVIRYYNQKVYSSNELASGIAIKYELKSSTSGAKTLVIADEGSKVVHYSRFRNLSSVRTLSEIIGRIYDQDLAISMLGRLKQADEDTLDIASVESLAYNTGEVTLTVDSNNYSNSFSGNANKQNIYDLSNWNSQVWKGTQVDHQEELIEASYVLPALTNNVADKVMEIRSYQELVKYTKLYPNGTFYLMNDISVQGEDVSPLCSRGNPFTGKLMSDPNMTNEDKNTHPNGFKITFNANPTNGDITGLFSAVKGATFKNLELVVNTNLSLDSVSNDGAIGVLFGYAYSKGNRTNEIENITITFAEGKKIQVNNNVKYVGVLGGYADALHFKGTSTQNSVTIVNPKIEISNSVSDLLKLENLYVGGVTGYVSIHSANASGYMSIQNPEISINLNIAGGGYDELAIGSVFGKVTNTSATSGEFALNNISVTNPKTNVTLSGEANKFVYFENVGIGGVFGLASGQNSSTLFSISNVNITTESSYEFNVTNNGVYAYSPIYSGKGNFSVGGIIGAIGTDGRGGINISSINLSANDKFYSYTHNNQSTNYLAGTKNGSNVNIGASIGAVITCSGNIQSLNSGIKTRWSVVEKDKVHINIGASIGRLEKGDIKNVVSTTNIESVTTTSDIISPVTLGENSCLNIGGLIGQMTGGSIISSGYNANIVVYTSANSTNNVNIGGLVGLATTNSDSYSISSCFAYGDIIFNSINKSSDIDNSMLYSANIGGMVGKVVDTLKINYAVTANDIIVRNGTLEENVFTPSTSEGLYNSIGGIVGLLYIDDQSKCDFDLVSVYSISNIIVTRNSSNDSQMGGLVGKTITSDGYDVSGQINVASGYYLANFILETNNIGKACSVEELLINNTSLFANDEHWLVEENKYPILRVTGAEYSRLTPHVMNVTALSSNDFASLGATVSAVIIKSESGDGIVSVAEALNVGAVKDIYFVGVKLNVSEDTKLFDSIANNQRVYGINMDSVSAPIINTNNGKISETHIGALTSATGYIATNNGFDIHVEANISSGALLYGTQSGLTIYGEITIASDKLDGDGSNGEYQLTIINYSSTKPTTTSKLSDSYMTNGTDYSYYSHSGVLNSSVTNLDSAKDITNFVSDYDFYNDWIIFSIPEDSTEDYISKRKDGRVFLRWELSKIVGGKWYFEGIDIYSNSQVAYHEYAWNNYVNYLNTQEGTSWVELGASVSAENIAISSAVGLAYTSSLINNGQYTNYNIALTEDVDLSGRLFTPIGGALIINKMQLNSFKGTFNGNNHSIESMDIITNGYGGLFGSSSASSYSSVTIKNSHVLSTGTLVGGFVASQQASAVINNVQVSNSTSISLMTSSEKTNVVGGVVGQIYNSSPRTNIVSVEITNSGLTSGSSVYSGNYVGGLVGEVVGSSIAITSCFNEYTIKGLDRVGGLVGSIGESSSIRIYKSHNYGDIVATSVQGIAGGLIGYDKADSTAIQISYNSSYVSGYYASGMIGYLCGGGARFEYTYVSRGDIGAILNGVTNTRNDSDASVTNNMNTNSISGNESGGEYAYVYVSDSSINVEILESYSSLYGDDGVTALGLTNSSSAIYDNSYVISSTNNNTTEPKQITHNSLSQANNEIFDNWKDIWSRVSQKNNNYPVFMDSAWTGSEEGIEKDGENYYIITTEEQLAWVATQVNTGADDFSGDTIQVGKEASLTLDFSKKLWSPIGYSTSRNFKGTMDFRNVTIKNLTTNGYYLNGTFNEDNLIKNYVGLFGYTNGATIKGSVTFVTDDTTLNEGSHISTEGRYAGALIGYAMNTMLENLTVVNKLNVQGTVGDVGGIIGGYELSSSFEGSEVTIGNFTNYGSVSGKYEDSQNIGGVIGRISAPDDKTITIRATSMYNYGIIGAGSGSSSGLVALIEGENVTLDVGIASSNASIENSGTELGGLFGKSEGTLIIGQAIISNDTAIAVASEGDDANKIVLSSNNTSAHIGAIIGYGNNVTIKTTVYDNDGIKICDKNVLNTTAFNQMSGAIGGFVGYVNNLTIMVRSSLEVKNIEFVHNGENNENNYIGGIAGMVKEALTIDSESNNTTLTVNNVTGIKGIGYLGGVAGYIGRYSMQNVTINVTNVCVEEVTDKASEHYQEYANKSEDLLYNTFGSVGGVFGYIGGGVSGSKVYINDITTSSTDNAKYYVKSKTYYAGGIVGKIGVSASLSRLTNNLNVNGDFSSNARDIGGIAGYINTTTGNSTMIEECKNYSSIVAGYEHVGGIVGQVHSASILGCETRNTAVGTYDEETNHGSWFVGGIVGESNNTYIESSYFTGDLAGSNYIGGIVGVAKNSNIYTAIATIRSIVAKPSENIGIGSHPDIEIFAFGGIVGYIYSNTSRSYVTNVDVNMSFVADKVNTGGILFGGAIGYALNTDIKEASTYISTLDVPNVYGVVNKLFGSRYSVNWYCNHYWMVGDTDSQENLYMSYVYDLKNNGSAIKNENYDETVIYKLKNTEENRDSDTLTTFKFANGNTISDGESVVESYERVKQIYFEAGLWEMTTSNLNTTNLLTENVSLSLDNWIYRMVSIEGDATINLESAPSIDDTALTYQSVYRGLTQRYRPDKTAINLTLTVRDNLSSCGEHLPNESTYYSGILQPVKRIDDYGNPYLVDATYSKIYNGQRIVLPLGSKFFPINNLTIIGSGDTRYDEGYEGYEQNKVSKIYLPNSNYGVGSMTDTAYNLYGFVGYTTGTVTITNVEFYTEYSGGDSFVAEYYDGTSTVKSMVSPHAEVSADKIVGSVVAVAHNQTVTLDNVSSSINIDGGDSYVTGGIIGSINGSTLNLRGITYKGTINGDSSIAGGVMGYAYNSTINAKEYVNDAIDTSISKSSYKHQCITGFSESITYNTFTDLDEDGLNVERKLKYGIKNEGTIYGEYVAGGLFGVIADTNITSIDENGVTTNNTVPLLLWNTGNVSVNVSDDDSIVGGIAGILQGKNQGYTLRNTYSGNITVNYSLSGDLTYEYSETQPTYLGSVVGGFVGYAYAENGEPTIEHGVNSVQLVDTAGEIKKVSVGIGAVSASAVSYKDIINFGDVSLNAENLGSFYMETGWYKPKPNAINSPSLTTSTTLDIDSFTYVMQEMDRLYLENIINLGDVTSTDSNASVGGLVGGIKANSYDVVFINCYNYSNVTGTGESEVGGYIGMMYNASRTMTVGTNSNYNNFLSVVGRYVTEDSAPTYITGKYAGGVIGQFYVGKLMGHINTVLNVDDSITSNYAIQTTSNYTETVTNYINPSIKLRATDSIITTNNTSNYAYVGGIIGYANDQEVLVFTKIEAPKVNVVSKAAVGGVVGDVDSSTNGVIAFQSIDVDDVSLTNGDGYGIGGLAGSVRGGRIIGELINVNGDITGHNASTTYDLSVGGLIGMALYCKIIDFNTVNIIGNITGHNASTTYDLSVGGLIGMALYCKIIDFNTVNIIGNITGRTMRGIGVGGLFGCIENSSRNYTHITNATVTGDVSATAEDGAIYSDSLCKNISAGGIVGYTEKVYSFIVSNSAVRTTVIADGFASYAGGIVGRTEGSNINVEGDTRVGSSIHANYKEGASYTSESQLSSAGGLVGYANNSGMTFKNTTLSSVYIKGYVAGGLVGMVSGNYTTLGIDDVEITGRSRICGYLYMSTIVGMATDGASDKLDDANVNMSLGSGVTLESLCIGNKSNKIYLTRNGTQFEATKTIRHYTYNVSAKGTYSFSYKDSEGNTSVASYSGNDIVVEQTVSRTVESFGRNGNDRPVFVKSFTIGGTTYNGSYDVFYGNRDKSSSIGGNINITNASLFAWVEEYDMNYIKSNYTIHETESSGTYEKEAGTVQFTNNGEVYQSSYQGDMALSDANFYGQTGAVYMANEAITAYIARNNLNVDKYVSSEDLFASNLEYQISSNVMIYRFINPIG